MKAEKIFPLETILNQLTVSRLTDMWVLGQQFFLTKYISQEMGAILYIFSI